MLLAVPLLPTVLVEVIVIGRILLLGLLSRQFVSLWIFAFIFVVGVVVIVVVIVLTFIFN